MKWITYSKRGKIERGKEELREGRRIKGGIEGGKEGLREEGREESRK